MIEKLKQIEGLRTINEISEIFKITRQSAINLISKLKKEGFVSTTGGRQQKRIYKITTYKQTESKGMFDLINKYSKIKVVPVFKHIVHGKYTVENALIDAIILKNRRTLLASLSLFNHVIDWGKLGILAKKFKIEVQVGCLYDLAKNNIKVRRIPKKLYESLKRMKSKKIVEITSESEILDKEWNCKLPFSKEDLKRLK